MKLLHSQKPRRRELVSSQDELEFPFDPVAWKRAKAKLAETRPIAPRIRSRVREVIQRAKIKPRPRQVARMALLAVVAVLFSASSPVLAWETQSSWYSTAESKHPMANGKPLVDTAYSAASWDYPLGTWLEVSCGKRKVVCQVTDRGPNRRLYRQGRRLDLSRATFQKLAPLANGVLIVQIKRLVNSNATEK